MNSDLVKNIISLAASIISLIILILSLLQTRTERTTSPIDSPSLKLISIDRIMYSKGEAVKIINDRIINYIALTGTLITSNGFLIFLSIDLIIFYIIFLTIMLISIVFWFISIKLAILKRFPERIRYDLFKNIEITIEADGHYLFNKSHEALRQMKFRIEDVNEVAGCIIASYIPFFNIMPKRLNVKMEEVKGQKNVYMVNLVFVTDVDAWEKSKIINRFINQLISKSKYTEDKGTNKTELPNDGWD